VLADLPIEASAHPTNPRLGYALYLTAAVLFGINGTVSKVLLLSVGDAARVSQLRVTAAFLLLAALVALTRPATLRIRRGELGLLVAYGVLGVALCQWLYFIAISRMPVGIALLIEFTAPIMVALWVRFGWHRPVRNTLWLGLALAILGLAMVAQVWSGFTLDGPGVLAAGGAAGALAVYYVLGESGGSARDSVSLTMWGFGFAALMWALAKPWWNFPWESLSGSAQPLGQGTLALPLWSLAGYMVVLGTIVPFWLVLASIGHIGASGASIIGLTEPLIASVIAWLVLGEVLTPLQMLGGVVILSGVVVAERARIPG
jgi:drug/metabolite transporter (DMT)-like permease